MQKGNCINATLLTPALYQVINTHIFPTPSFINDATLDVSKSSVMEASLIFQKGRASCVQ